MTDIAGLFGAHSHQDHKAIKPLSGCHVYALPKERDWIEDVRSALFGRIPPVFAMFCSGRPTNSSICILWRECLFSENP